MWHGDLVQLARISLLSDSQHLHSDLLATKSLLCHDVYLVSKDLVTAPQIRDKLSYRKRPSINSLGLKPNKYGWPQVLEIATLEPTHLSKQGKPQLFQ